MDSDRTRIVMMEAEQILQETKRLCCELPSTYQHQHDHKFNSFYILHVTGTVFE